MSTSEPTGTFVVTGARVFDGEQVLDGVDVLVDDSRIVAAAAHQAHDGLPVVDGAGATLLPGLIDSHTHPAGNALALAIKFGVTTEMDMSPSRSGWATSAPSPPSETTSQTSDRPRPARPCSADTRLCSSVSPSASSSR